MVVKAWAVEDGEQAAFQSACVQTAEPEYLIKRANRAAEKWFPSNP